MKKISLIFLIFWLSIAFGYTKTVTTEDGFLSFEVPEECGCIDIFQRNPRKLEICGYTIIKPFIYKTEFSIPFYKLLTENDFEIDLLNIRKLLETNSYIESDDFALDPSYRLDEFSGNKRYIGFLPKSYKPIIMDKILGEEYMYANTDYCFLDKSGGDTIGYHITFVLNDRLERIAFTRIISDGISLINSFPQWFEMRSDGNYYWINQECLDAMYDLLFSDDYKKLPRDLQLIRETRDMILNTVRINNPPVDTSKLKEGVITH